MSATAEKRLSSAQRAVQQLREMIFAGELPAGSNHLESELAFALNMSRTPVREAVLTLEGQGLLELRPRKGVRITPLKAKDMAEIYDILTELESLAAADAARHNYTDADLSDLSQAIDDMDRALATPDLQAWAQADDRFHAALVTLGGNDRIEAIVNMMSDQVRRARASTLLLRPLPTKSNEDHREVYMAIRNGDPDTARASHRAHRQHAKEVLVGILEKHSLLFL